MKNLEDLEKKINSELTTKINKTEIKHNQLYIEINKVTSIKSSLSVSIYSWLCLISVLLILVVNSELIFFSKSIKLFIII